MTAAVPLQKQSHAANLFHEISVSANQQSETRFQNWTPEMHRFYNEIDPAMVNVTLEDLLKDIPGGSVISSASPENCSTADKGKTFAPKHRASYRSGQIMGLSCSLCKSFGHSGLTCRKHHSRRIRCHMCGENHNYLNCPQSLCLRDKYDKTLFAVTDGLLKGTCNLVSV